MEGRGMFYGETDQWGHARVFSPGQWDAICRQAVDWGIQWLHPKVADHDSWWYDPNPGNRTGTPEPSLAMLAIGAHHYGLKLAPYHYCFGNKYGQLTQEAQISATIANMCDACVPDMESEWNNQPQWALDFGKIVRQHSPHGQFYPTLFGDPDYFPGQPYVEWSHWIDGWMPMVYFSVWTNRHGQRDTAQDAVDFVYPMWERLSQRVNAAGISAKRILPLIEVGSALPPQEVANWLHLMGDYGYCGFWYDGQYASYANAVKSQPVPALPHQTPVPTPQVEPYTPIQLAWPHGITAELGESTVKQNLTHSQLQALWDMNGRKAVFNLQDGIPATWAALVQNFPDKVQIGAPHHEEAGITVDGEACTYIDFDGGVRLVYFKSTNSVVMFTSPTSVSVPPPLPTAIATLQTMITPVVSSPGPVTPAPAVAETAVATS